VLNQTSDELKLEKHPDKTVQARTERGFEFMGYHSQSGKLYVAGYTLERFKQRIARLYEFRLNSVQWLQPKPFMDCSYWSD
jgi:RNA-directed DNA polymerase